MIGRWWQRRREAHVLHRRAIPDPLWAQTLANYPFIAGRTASVQAELRRLSTLFLAEKEFTPAQGLELTDEMAVAIAAQACLPVLRWGLPAYRGLHSIVVHPDEVVAPREYVDDAGVVHEYEEVLAGEAMPGGPVMLSWRDVEAASEAADWAYNVVIHEFVHVLDMNAGGDANGFPFIDDLALRARWRTSLPECFDRFCNKVAHGEEGFLDPYAAEGLEEFFPVAAEAFFVAPRRLKAADAALYDLLRDYFEQDPAADI